MQPPIVTLHRTRMRCRSTAVFLVSSPGIVGLPQARLLWRWNEDRVHSTYPAYNVRCEPGRQTSNTDSYINDGISGIKEIFGDQLKLWNHAHLFYSAAPFTCWVKAISTFRDSVAFRNFDSNEQEREETVFIIIMINKKNGLVYVKNRCCFNCSHGRISLYGVNMLGNLVQFWQWGLDVCHTILNLAYHFEVH